MSFWKRLKDAAFGTSQNPPDLAENQSSTAPRGPTPTDPPPTLQEHHHQAVEGGSSLQSEDDSRSANSAAASVIDITLGTRQNAISLVDYLDSDLSDEANESASLAQPRRIPPSPELDHNELRINHRTEQQAITALNEFA